jgi:hypothetical protein
MQSRSELEISKERLESAIRLMQDELRRVELRLAKLSAPERLDDAFFWDRLVRIILENPIDLTSSQLFSIIERRGISVSEGGFRTFLSRKKKQGLLRTQSAPDGKARWKLTDKVEKMSKSLRTGSDQEILK